MDGDGVEHNRETEAGDGRAIFMTEVWPSYSSQIWQQEINEILPKPNSHILCVTTPCRWQFMMMFACRWLSSISIFTTRPPQCDKKTSLPLKDEKFPHHRNSSREILVYVLNHPGYTIDIKYGLNTRAVRILNKGGSGRKNRHQFHIKSPLCRILLRSQEQTLLVQRVWGIFVLNPACILGHTQQINKKPGRHNANKKANNRTRGSHCAVFEIE